jgi:hypothetical protein
MPHLFAPSRFEAACRMERARQIVRECKRYGYPVTPTDIHAVHDAERDYDLATAQLAR